MAEVRMTLDEYRDLLRLIESERESEGASLAQSTKSKKKRKVSRYNREFGKQLKKVKSTSRLKSGKLRSGWSVSKEMSKAHKMTKKALK